MSDVISRAQSVLREQWTDFTRVNRSDRPWQMPFAAGLAAGLPIAIGAWFGHVEYGLISSLGGMTFLYTPNTRMTRRMVTLMACGFGMTASFALGAATQMAPWAQAPALAFMAALATVLSRYFQMPPPGNFFFVMSATMGMFTPTPLLQWPYHVGLSFLGAFLALAIAFVYSLVEMRLRPPRPPAEPRGYEFDAVIFDSLVIGLTIGAALALAQAFGMDRPYWVPVSCAAVIQGQNLQAVWTKQLQRIIGTGLGLMLALALLSLRLDGWGLAALVTGLSFLIETAVVRHYGFAALFISPLTIMMAEAAHPAATPIGALIGARFYDTVLGCLIGVAGAALIHRPRLRAFVSRPLRKLADAVLERR